MKSPTITRYKLADKLCKLLGMVVEAHKIIQNNNVHRKNDGIAWDCISYDSKSNRLIRIYSWDTMDDLVKNEIDYLKDPFNDIEVFCK